MAIHFVCADTDRITPELGEILTNMDAIRVIHNTLWMIETDESSVDLHKRLQNSMKKEALVVISPGDGTVSTNYLTAKKSSMEILHKLEETVPGAFGIGRAPPPKPSPPMPF